MIWAPLCAALLSLVAAAQQPAAERPFEPAIGSIEEIAFIAGHWHAQVGATRFEELTMPPLHGNITASMRMIGSAGEGEPRRTVLWELISYDETEDGSLTMRVRHYSGPFEPWDVEVEHGPLTLTATQIESGARVVFSDLNEHKRVDSITLEREGDASLKITVRDPDGSELVIPYERVR